MHLFHLNRFQVVISAEAEMMVFSDGLITHYGKFFSDPWGIITSVQPPGQSNGLPR
jgi:hypothetical protein